MSIETIKSIIFDVDGVLTDGGIIYDNQGNEIKKFNVKDGQIISHLRSLGFFVGVITGRNSPVVKYRCEELKLDFHYHGSPNKLVDYEKIKRDFKLLDENIAYIGDDIIDLPILARCGFSGAPTDAREYIKKEVDYVTASKGGEGALRDFADHILQEQGLFNKVLEKYLKGEC
ncbi:MULTISPECIES: KdsC family phosphatase [unclassified Francisella]|uniref:KdsC family phosphatase n=1 Tax=unclassified Francisella TaxID=2610885 RepID=UPI002E30E955|nr:MULTISPECIES: HAD hydrolase family protein [unclassified Francisella]MED7820131.1 HAD hydrolase family protein [Francisella sp. 19S2-4]MED7830938.1 HAD hydrolase family protein [Francisella sp. 19S2-10]